MPKIAATIVETITGSAATTDGRHMVLQVRTTDGEDLALGVRHAQIMQLIDHCAVANVACEKILCKGIESKAAVSWWNSALERESGEFVLSLTFGRGGALSFALTEPMAKALLATLQCHFEADAPRSAPEKAANILLWPEGPLERRIG